MKNIREEIGRNFHTLNNDPVPFDYDENIKVSTIATSDGDWQVTINVDSNPEHSVATQTFKDEQMATHYSRQAVQSIKSSIQNESLIRECVRKYIQKICKSKFDSV